MHIAPQEVSARGERPPESPNEYTGPTYYDRPTVKSSSYGWLVWTYTYVAGLAGGAQIIATLASMTRRPQWDSVVRNGRALAMLGPTVGAGLLIADLHTPQRFYNMLRIFRKTSPMSIGTYILSGFGLSSAITAGEQLLGRFRPFAWLRKPAAVAQVPAALAGAGMCTYTGSLLSSTSTPMWAAAPRLLTIRFGCSAMATAAAALSIGEQLRGNQRNSKTLDRIALLATLAETAVSAASKSAYEKRGVSGSVHGKRKEATEEKLTTGVASVLPLLCYGLNDMLPGRSRKLSMLGSLGVLAGGLLMRSSVFHSGNRSAVQPRDYLGFTQPSPERGQLRAIK